MSDDFPYTFGVIPIKHMMVDIYQRPLSSFVDKIEHNFDPALIGTLVLSKRSATKYALVDGQTRAEAMKRLGFSEAPSVVYEGLTRAQEADLFARLQTERRGMHSVSRFKAQVVAGREPAVTINKLVEHAGFTFVSNASELPLDQRGRALSAPAAIEYIYRGCKTGMAARNNEHPDLVSDTLMTIKQAWPKSPDGARSSPILRGVGYFMVNEQNVDLDKLAARLGKVQPSELGRRADMLREGEGVTGNSPKYMADAIKAQYNRRGGS